MANAVYPLYKTAILTAAANTSLDQNTVNDGPYVALSDTGVIAYSPLHDFYDDVAAATVASGRITTPTVGAVTGGGTFDGDNVTFSAVVGAQCEALIVYRHNAGANTTWRLVLYLDSLVTGLPVTPNGGDIVVAWNVAGIFTI